MTVLIAIVVFVVVSAAVFAGASLLDQRNARARLLRDRLATMDKTPEGQPNADLALLRDEMLSKIPAFDSLLRRSARISNLQPFLEQAALKVRAGNIVTLCAVSAVTVGAAPFFATQSMPGNESLPFVMVGVVLGGIAPYSYTSYRRSKRFQKFEEMFPEAIDTLARAVRA